MFFVVYSLSTGIVEFVMGAAMLHWLQMAGTFSEDFLRVHFSCAPAQAVECPPCRRGLLGVRIHRKAPIEAGQGGSPTWPTVIHAGWRSRGLEPEPSRCEAAGADAVLHVQGHER